ncbi:TIM23 complex component [Amphichorda felina]
MSAPLKTFVLRLPSRPASLSTRCCARASLTTTARPVTTALSQQALRPSTRSTIMPQLQQLRRKTDDAAGAQKSAGAPPPLDWNTFFKLRLRRRRIQVFFSATMGVVGFAAGAALLPTGLAEPLVSQIPLDPFISLGLLTVAFAGVGWLVGPSIGSQVFYMANRRLKSQIAQKEAEFFARIKKNRVDPTNSSAANPVPDFYGEKIQSVHGYRQWLKDQRAFNRKKSANLI